MSFGRPSRKSPCTVSDGLLHIVSSHAAGLLPKKQTQNCRWFCETLQKHGVETCKNCHWMTVLFNQAAESQAFRWTIVSPLVALPTAEKSLQDLCQQRAWIHSNRSSVERSLVVHVEASYIVCMYINIYIYMKSQVQLIKKLQRLSWQVQVRT